MSQPYYMAIAKTILSQLGGNRFITMTGAKHFVGLTEPGLQFDLPTDTGAINKVTRLRVILDSSDTYTVISFRKKRGQLYRNDGAVYVVVGVR
ncbi:hypothetical protein C9J44_19790 [Photobacterium sp. GB-27]|uniref:hypothetical protein n=1 Tax=Photobacterium sp. GB-27 TaxID=2022109 RepID=UPI000D16B15E|nr:hypothetical protein [Photobacterium sp. GB-27]PSV31576.1 hypothetical protein C9J44_19790 [Photobacterium sp. GB-27]